MSRKTLLTSALMLAMLGTPALARPKAGEPVDSVAPPIPSSWPQGASYVLPADAALPAYGYAQVLGDARLASLVDAALAHNQDMAAALANLEAARAQVRISKAALLPEIDATGFYDHGGGTSKYIAGTATKGDLTEVYGSAASYELDLFGRLRGAAAATRAQYLASEASARATRITLIASVANAWLAYAADASLLKVAQSTAQAARQSVALTKRRVEGGVAVLADLRKAELTQKQAEADVAAQTTAVAQDHNALRLLVGADLPASARPADIDDAARALHAVAPGLSSAILLRRPDVMQAEFTLRASFAQVDVARAALFPKITLTGAAGVASLALSNLLTGGAFAWGGTATLNYPIFRAGAAKANLRAVQAQRDASLAAYRKSIQTAFSDVANVLARAGTIDAQLAASQDARNAAADNYALVDKRYRGGVGTWLDALTAQQTLYTAEKTLVAVKLARANNLVGLYRALGGENAPLPAPKKP